MITEHKLTDEDARAFEEELNHQSFEDYCYASGFIKRHDGYHDYFVVEATIAAYQEAKKKYRALQSLRYRRKLARNHEEVQLNAQL